MKFAKYESKISQCIALLLCLPMVCLGYGLAFCLNMRDIFKSEKTKVKPPKDVWEED
jgi:hypothetical protein